MPKKHYISYLFISLLSFFILIPSFTKVHAQTCTYTPTSSNSVTSTVTISANGTYTVWSRILAPDTINNSFYLQIDNGCAINVGDSSGIAPNTWTWVNYQDGATNNSILLSLTAGDHTVKITERESGIGVDRIIFTIPGTCNPSGTGDSCAPMSTPTPMPTSTPTSTPMISPTNTPVLPTNTPTVTPNPTLSPTPLPNITVSNITMSYTKSGSKRNINTVVTVKNEATLGPIAGATVSLNLKSPRGTTYSFTGTTTTQGQVTFTKQSKETGMYQATVTNVSKAGYTYHPTNTVQYLNVQ